MYAYKLYKSGRFSENPSQIGSGILLSKYDNSEINNEDQKDTRIVHLPQIPPGKDNIGRHVTKFIGGKKRITIRIRKKHKHNVTRRINKRSSKHKTKKRKKIKYSKGKNGRKTRTLHGKGAKISKIKDNIMLPKSKLQDDIEPLSTAEPLDPNTPRVWADRIYPRVIVQTPQIAQHYSNATTHTMPIVEAEKVSKIKYQDRDKPVYTLEHLPSASNSG